MNISILIHLTKLQLLQLTDIKFPVSIIFGFLLWDALLYVSLRKDVEEARIPCAQLIFGTTVKIGGTFFNPVYFLAKRTQSGQPFSMLSEIFAFWRTFYKPIMQWRTKNDKYEGCTCGKMFRDKGRFQKLQARNIPSAKGAL